MQNTLEWSDLIPGGNSFNMARSVIYHQNNSRQYVHSYNHKVIYTTMIKTLQGGGGGGGCISINGNPMLQIDKKINKSRISIDKSTSQGLSIGDHVLLQKNFSQVC